MLEIKIEARILPTDPGRESLIQYEATYFPQGEGLLRQADVCLSGLLEEISESIEPPYNPTGKSVRVWIDRRLNGDQQSAIRKIFGDYSRRNNVRIDYQNFLSREISNPEVA